MNNHSKNNEIKRYMVMQCVFSLAVFICCFQNVVRSYNSTMLALSYEYGFTSRSLLGTIYHMLNRIIPIEMMDYRAVFVFACVVTGLFFLFLMYFTYVCINMCTDKIKKPVEALLFFFNTFAIATFSGAYNFFRVDLFMVVVALLSALVVMKRRWIWLLIPLSAIGVMFHQGFVFMYFNVGLVLLLYMFLDSEKGTGRKYLIVFLITLVLGSALFLWFELFSRTNGSSILESVVNDAKAVSFEGKYHSTLLAHEVLGIDLASSEGEWHKMSVTQLVWFTLLMVPFIIVFVRFFIGLFKKANEKTCKIKYVLLLIGAGTMLPDFLLKIDFGRWVMAVMTYYIVVIIAVAVIGDKYIRQELSETYQRIKTKPYAMLYFIYPIMFIPLCDTDIDGFVQALSAITNDILGIYSL